MQLAVGKRIIYGEGNNLPSRDRAKFELSLNGFFASQNSGGIIHKENSVSASEPFFANENGGLM